MTLYPDRLAAIPRLWVHRAGQSGTRLEKVNIMRATFDKVTSWAGLLLVAVLLVAGSLLTWASLFVGNQVHDQLAEQNITMPTTKTGLADLPAADQAALEQYAGQDLTTGPQAKAYADHYIKVHMNEAVEGTDVLRGQRPVHPAVHVRPESSRHGDLSEPRRTAPDPLHG